MLKYLLFVFLGNPCNEHLFLFAHLFFHRNNGISGQISLIFFISTPFCVNISLDFLKTPSFAIFISKFFIFVGDIDDSEHFF